MPPNNVVQLSFSGAPDGVFGLTNDYGLAPLSTYILVKDKDYMDYENEDHRTITFQVIAEPFVISLFIGNCGFQIQSF